LLHGVLWHDTPVRLRAPVPTRWHGQGVRMFDGFCLTCGSVTVFDQPPCPDAHNGDCPEWICRRCGAAVLVGEWPTSPSRVGGRPVPGRRAA